MGTPFGGAVSILITSADGLKYYWQLFNGKELWAEGGPEAAQDDAWEAAKKAADDAYYGRL